MPQQRKNMSYLELKPYTITREEIEKNKREIRSKWNKSIKKSKKKKARKPRKRTVIRSYRTYMKSSLWTRRKNKYFRTYGRKCKACRSSSFVTLHHMFYSSEYGHEPDQDVVALCGNCHHQFHEIYGVKKDMRKETKEFISEIRKVKNTRTELFELDNTIAGFMTEV